MSRIHWMPTVCSPTGNTIIVGGAGTGVMHIVVNGRFVPRDAYFHWMLANNSVAWAEEQIKESKA